jgi:hypothetical protein
VPSICKSNNSLNSGFAEVDSEGVGATVDEDPCWQQRRVTGIPTPTQRS